jgi:hypothetical protein
MHVELLHSDVVTVCYAVLLFGIMGTYIFEDNRNVLTVRASCYVHVTDDIFTPQVATHLEVTEERW